VGLNRVSYFNSIINYRIKLDNSYDTVSNNTEKKIIITKQLQTTSTAEAIAISTIL